MYSVIKWGLGALAASSVACSSTPTETATSVEPAGARLPANWSCLDTLPPPPPDDGPDEVEYVFSLVEALTDTPVLGWTVYVCGIGDTPCVAPLSRLVDEGGITEIALKLAAGQPLFLELHAPGYIRATLVLDGPLYADRRGPAIEMYSPAALQALAEQTRVPLDPTLGLLAIRGFDCNGNIAAGASYVLDVLSGTTLPYALSDGVFRASLPPAGADGAMLARRRSSGDRFMNVSPGLVRVFGLVDESREFGTGTANVSASAITNLEVRARAR